MRKRKKGFCLTGKESFILWMTSFFLFYFTPILFSGVAVIIILAVALFYYGSHDEYFINQSAIIFFRNKMGSVTVPHTNIRKIRRFKNLCVLLLIDEQRVFAYFFSKSDTEEICRLLKKGHWGHRKRNLKIFMLSFNTPFTIAEFRLSAEVFIFAKVIIGE